MAIKTKSVEFRSFANTMYSIKNGGWLMLQDGFTDNRAQSFILHQPVMMNVAGKRDNDANFGRTMDRKFNAAATLELPSM
mmetsp:Transcript_33262/g.41124  ORF Transcript_33262/g.41124 Transcript_33262/m.41124 type:complete len:80 (+) Transcript_33262:500-739(+)